MGAGMGLKVTKAAAPAVKTAAGWLGRQLIVKPLWKAQQGFVNPLTAWQTYDTITTWSQRAEMAIAIAQIVEGSSSQDLVQNGGPPAPPLRQSGRPSDVLSLGKTLKTQSAHGFSSGKAPTAGGKRAYALPRDVPKNKWIPNPCRKGYTPKNIKGRWYCVPIRKR